MEEKKRTGLILVNTGNGKGKTTAALGTALRAHGQGMKVLFVQFIKGKWKTGERQAAPFEIVTMGAGFTWTAKPPGTDEERARAAWEFAKEKIAAGGHDVVVLDEISYPVNYGFIPLEKVVEALQSREPSMHVILTGRDMPGALVELADLATEMKEIKHPFKRGIQAQRGIEF